MTIIIMTFIIHDVAAHAHHDSPVHAAVSAQAAQRGTLFTTVLRSSTSPASFPFIFRVSWTLRDGSKWEH